MSLSVGVDVVAKLGIENDGVVYASTNFTATSGDELSVTKGARLKILRKANCSEFEWWWASCDGKEGYVPQYVLAVSISFRVLQHYDKECIALVLSSALAPSSLSLVWLSDPAKLFFN